MLKLTFVHNFTVLSYNRKVLLKVFLSPLASSVKTLLGPQHR